MHADITALTSTTRVTSCCVLSQERAKEFNLGGCRPSWKAARCEESAQWSKVVKMPLPSSRRLLLSALLVVVAAVIGEASTTLRNIGTN
ncbi:hypothetical protein CYMTET_17184, partial [Cymbomonas tetramitiformis]